MDAHTPHFAAGNNADAGRLVNSQLSRQWAALQDAGAAVAMLAGLAPEGPSQKIRNFPVLIREVEEWKMQLAADHVADLTAMMQPGLSALLAVNARGQDATAAALTLWREYHAARDAVLALLPEAGAMGPQRSA